MPKPTFEQVYNILASESDRFLAARKVTGLFYRAWEGAPQADVEPDDLEQHNREQHIRREAFREAASFYCGDRPDEAGPAYDAWNTLRNKEAARKYPLRRRVPKVIFDPHGLGEWRMGGGDLFQINAGKSGEWRDANSGVYWSASRVRTLAALLDDPWTYEEDTSAEGSDLGR